VELEQLKQKLEKTEKERQDYKVAVDRLEMKVLLISLDLLNYLMC
jgi:hypothetical protein